MKKPLIGITSAHDCASGDLRQRPTYFHALTAAGALGLPLPLECDREDLRRLTALCDGFLFSGGPDPHPFLFGQETHAHCGEVSPLRDAMECDLLQLAMEAQKPILGICRGLQLINVALGGDLIQDIPSQCSERAFPVCHKQLLPYDLPSHHVKIAEGTRLLSVTSGQRRLAVNSMHHQAVCTAAPGLTVSARSDDGLIEALELAGYPFLLGVQWHPEYLWRKDPQAKALFCAFVNACG